MPTVCRQVHGGKQLSVLMPDLIVWGKGECKLHASHTISAGVTRLATVLMGKWGGLVLVVGGGVVGYAGASDPRIMSPLPPPSPHQAPTICSSITIASRSLPPLLRLPSLHPSNLVLTHFSLLRRAPHSCPPSSPLFTLLCRRLMGKLEPPVVREGRRTTAV